MNRMKENIGTGTGTGWDYDTSQWQGAFLNAKHERISTVLISYLRTLFFVM